jgi:hypothetical protein
MRSHFNFEVTDNQPVKPVSGFRNFSLAPEQSVRLRRAVIKNKSKKKLNTILD